MAKQPNLRTYVLWELKLRGDINEKKLEKPNAAATLRSRLLEAGLSDDFASSGRLSSAISALEEAGKIVRESDGRRSHAIKLQRNVELGDNPFEKPLATTARPAERKAVAAAQKQATKRSVVIDEIAKQDEPVETGEVVLNGYSNWPAEKKMALATALTESALQDIVRAKASL